MRHYKYYVCPVPPIIIIIKEITEIKKNVNASAINTFNATNI